MSARRSKITKAFADAQKPEERMYKVLDKALPGFSMRIYPIGPRRPQGRKAFYFRYRVGGGRNGQIREPLIGELGKLTVDEARSIAKDWAAVVRQGGDPGGERLARRQAPTMNELFDMYMNCHARVHKKASSAANDLRMIDRHLRPSMGTRQVATVSRHHIRDVHNRLMATPYEANRVLALASKIFSYAADELEWIERGDHPVKGIKRFPEKKRRRYLSQVELASLGVSLARAEAGELSRQISIYVVAMIRLLLLTGARHGEILKLRWDEVNLDRACLELKDSKTGEKDIHLSPAALQVLTALPRSGHNPYVIPGRIPGSHLVNLKDPWSIIRKDAGLEDVRIHDLRHSFASVGARAGMSLPVIGALLGHRETATTARYAHLSDDPLKLAADSIGEEIAAALVSRNNG